MKKVNKFIILAIAILLLLILSSPPSAALLKRTINGEGTVRTSTWGVSMEEDDNTEISIINSEYKDGTYTFTVSSNSEVDVDYSIIISNIPTGVRIKLDDGEFKGTSTGTLTYENIGTILYTDSPKEKEHTLTFKALSSAAPVEDWEISLDVVMNQKME